MDLGALAPRSDEEILETLDQGFYTESFDPALHMLVGAATLLLRHRHQSIASQ